MGVKTRRSLALLVCLLLGASLSAAALSVAFADDGYISDEDDSPGPFDIERFGFFQEEDGGHLTIDLYENLDPTLLDEQLDWIGFILEDDIVNDGYVQAVFVTYSGTDIEAALYGPGRGGPEESRFIKPVGVQLTDPNTLDVYIDDQQYAWFHNWYAQTSFETIGQDDRGYPECNWPSPPPRPFPPMAKCIDESNSVNPTIESPGPTYGTPTSSPDPECAFKQSQCRKNYITIHRADRSFYGVVRNRRDNCVGDRKVVLRRPNTSVVGRDVTNAEGKWRIPLGEAHGSYHALAREMDIVNSAGGSTTCHRLRSIDIEG